jgi:hypothetical protein
MSSRALAILMSRCSQRVNPQVLLPIDIAWSDRIGGNSLTIVKIKRLTEPDK